jgi:CRP/FNR family transcriptional regulator
MAYLDSEIKQIDINYFKQLLLQNSKFAKEVIDILISNSVQINGRFFCLTHKQSYGRLADILLCLADRIFKASEFDLNLSRKDLAELSGISPETVVRMLKKFKDEGLIHIDGKKFQIIDYDRLKRISETG